MLKYRSVKLPVLFASFWFALRGLVYTIFSQRNMQIHILLAGITIVLGIYFKLSLLEYGLLSLSIFLVLICETINTALEISVDLVTKKRRLRAMLSKDIAAGAVLLSALNSVIIGIFIFYPKIALFL